MGIKDASWISHPSRCDAPVFRKTFTVPKGFRAAVADLCGLGWHVVYINGVKVGDDVFAPAVTTYAKLRGRRLLYPLGDEFASPRVLYCRYDVSTLLRSGLNTIAVMVGNGWYNQTLRTVEGDFSLGAPRLAFSIRIHGRNGNLREILSDKSAKAGESHVVANNLFHGEVQDFSRTEAFFNAEFDDSRWPLAVEAEAPEGRLTLQECPPDRIIRTLHPKRIGSVGKAAVYDVGENTTGWIKFDSNAGGKVVIEHSELLDEYGRLDFKSTGGEEQVQRAEYRLDGKPRRGLHPHFTWHGFRYFTVEGEIENPVCEVVHTDIKAAASFRCGDEVLNGFLDMYVRTQLGNIHGSVPTDCPHRERLGYTGDGQVTCGSVMELFDARALYRKWVRDIFDCQCRRSGHIQHTAPFGGGGGGPGGWGGAAVVVPWEFWRRWGDLSLFAKYSGRIMHWLDYMETCSTDGLVAHEEEGGWCLGEWSVPGVEEIADVLPEPFVNTCILVRCLGLAAEAFAALGDRRSAALCRRRARKHGSAVEAAYFNRRNGDFASGRNGANAFAIDAGLGDGRTLKRLVAHCRGLRAFDTGIFGTEAVVRILCERGFTDVAYAMISSRAPGRSFGWMLDRGATTLWENWDGADGSHNHPMLGGCAKVLVQHFLGIRRAGPGDGAYVIAPADIAGLGDMEGHVTTEHGKLSLRLRRNGPAVSVRVDVPDGVKATLNFRGKVRRLAPGVFSCDFP